jgi:hypothetical protein
MEAGVLNEQIRARRLVKAFEALKRVVFKRRKSGRNNETGSTTGW